MCVASVILSGMTKTSPLVNPEYLPFYITSPVETDVLLGAVAFTLVAVLIGFGALYFTIQNIPDRLVEGTSKAQMQIVGLLGLISLFSMNNLYWVIALLVAAVRIPDVVTMFKSQARSQKRMSMSLKTMEPEAAEPPPKPEQAPAAETVSEASTETQREETSND